MGYISRESMTLVTDGSSNSTQFSSGVYSGFIHAIRYATGTASNIATVATLTITPELSGLDILADTNTSVSHTAYPRCTINTTGGVALGLSSGQFDRVPLGQERVKVVVSQGGATKNGTLILMIEGA